MREATLHTWSMSIFEPPELMEPCKVYHINSIDAYRMMTFKISIQGGTKQWKPQVNHQRTWYWRVHKSQNYLNLFSFRLYWFWTIFETTNSSAEGECFEWKAIGQCSKGDSCSFRHDLASGNICVERQEGHSSSLAPKAKAQTDGQTPKVQAAEERALLEQEAEFRAEIPSEESVRILHSIFGTLPCVFVTSLNQDAHMVINADSDTLRPMCSPAKSWRKVVWKGQLLYSRTLYNLVVCLKILIGEKLFYGKLENWDQIAPSHSPRYVAPHQNSGKKGPSWGVIQKCEFHERSPCDPKFEEMTQDETLHQEQHVRGVAWYLAKSVYNLEK